MASHALPTVVRQPKGTPKRETDAAQAQTRTRQDIFISALLEVPCEYKRRNPLEWAVSFLAHVVAIAGLLVIPLCVTQTLDLKAFQSTWLVAPAPPAPPPPPAAPMVRQTMKSVERLMQGGKMMAPTVIPRKVAMIKEEPLPPDTGASGVIGGVPGGIPGGQVGGVLGGIIGGGSNPLASAPPPPPAKRIVRIGGNLKPPRQIYAPAPQYPILAKEAKIEGTVVIDAIIDEQGSVVQARILGGPGLLVGAALEAVTSWKYEPTRLNGEPISVEMRVEVHFVLQ
ncbi:MAG TPA: energy transducer TonB [Candidatus Cybelea sp.]|nr:energy transducer TonB [Candidatus Cybelea sp.]